MSIAELDILAAATNVELTMPSTGFCSTTTTESECRS